MYILSTKSMKIGTPRTVASSVYVYIWTCDATIHDWWTHGTRDQSKMYWSIKYIVHRQNVKGIMFLRNSFSSYWFHTFLQNIHY